MARLLPDLPSALVHTALADLEWCEYHPEYEIDMTIFHTSRDSDRCRVCLAGAVMARSLEAPLWLTWGPWDFPEDQHKLRSLDSFRGGHIRYGLGQLGLLDDLLDEDGEMPAGLPGRISITPYETDRDKFWEDMEEMIRLLEAAGL